MDKRLDKYIDYIVADITKNIVWDDVLDHIMIMDGDRVNTCNLWAGPFYVILVAKYGITETDFQWIVERLKDYFDNYYPYRCDP